MLRALWIRIRSWWFRHEVDRATETDDEWDARQW